KALERMVSQKTVIAVAHRLSTIKNYDHIFVLQNGRLLEEGTHQGLIKKNGEYAKLYKLGKIN
ncbi:MAG: ABC transporter ATP-binding protein, partial [Halobacteriovoraceae bacterium]|nr:ABC transporter ATP-binding protein [Halobacteriovoraceae bacterium]